jgi:tetraacyldisaccharide 4'-kinase
VLRLHPKTDVFVLDDGFQHRKVARDLNLVLIDATNPFGYGHVLPRGMLREPLAGLRRADAFMITRADQANAEGIAQIEKTLRQYNTDAPIFHAKHAMVGFKHGVQSFASDALRGKKILALCGIGNPTAFHQQLLNLGAIDGGLIALDDHHAYSAEEIQRLNERANAVGADVLLTTEKDWVKLEGLAEKSGVPIWRAELEVQLAADESEKLMGMIAAIIQNQSLDSSRGS